MSTAASNEDILMDFYLSKLKLNKTFVEVIVLSMKQSTQEGLSRNLNSDP